MRQPSLGTAAQRMAERYPHARLLPATPDDFAAWLGLTPKQASSGEKTLSGKISKQGDEPLRRLFVLGAATAHAQGTNHTGLLTCNTPPRRFGT